MKKIAVFILVLGLAIVFAAGVALAGFCPECGAKNDDASKFCVKCGAKLSQAEGSKTGGETKSADSNEELPKIVEKVSPSVVLVRTLENNLNAVYQDMGSGFVVDKEGHVVTNGHVIGDPEELDGVKVLLSDKKEYDAKVLYCDYQADIAVLKIQADNLVPIKFGDIDKLHSGEKVFVVGNPLGLEKSTSTGIVSATGRYLGSNEYEGLIQTDAAVNPGNSGGPLFNMQGEVVGVTSLGYSKWYSEGLNFAIPILLVTDTLKYLSTCKVKRPWIGIAVNDLTPDLKQWQQSAHEVKVTETEGVFVNSIAEGIDIPVKKGDIIVKLGDMPVKKVWDLQKGILSRKVGDEINLVVKRDGKDMSFKVKLAEKPLQEKFPIEDEIDCMFGATLSNGSSGTRIEKIRPKCLASGMGFKEGWEISAIQVNKKKGGDRIETGSTDGFYEAFRGAYNYKEKYIEWQIYFTKHDGSMGSDKYWYKWVSYHVAMTTT